MIKTSGSGLGAVLEAMRPEGSPESPASPGASGNWAEANLNAAGLAQINRAGRTRFRLFFQIPADNNRVNDRIGWWSGGSAAGNRPELVVEYE